MRKASWLFAFVLAFAVVGLGRTQEKTAPNDTSRKSTASSEKKESPQQDQSATSLRAGTKISAELATSLDARTAKPGDEVAARVTKNVKQDGRMVIRKGDRLLGHVTSLEANSAAQAGSQLAVTFDRLQQGQTTTQLNTVISQVLSAQAAPPDLAPPMAAEPSMGRAPMGGNSGGGNRGGGGVVGGATSTVGQTANSTLGTASSTVQGVQNTAGVSTQSSAGPSGKSGLATPIANIHLDSMAQATNQNQAASVLSTKNGSLRMDSGTRLEFRVAGQAETHKPAN